MGKFGWDLPPGCSMNDIERAYGDQPNMQEAFESQEKMNEQEAALFEDWCNNDDKLNFLDRLMTWAVDIGYKACQADDEENKYSEETAREHQINKRGEAMVQRPKEIDQYQADYRDGAWAEYSEEEYRWWVHLLTQRATHRTNTEKKMKDLTDARNYLLMFMAKVEAETGK